MKRIEVIRVGKESAYALVDDEDYAHLQSFFWCLNQKGYAQANVKIDGKWTTMKMQREVLGLKVGDKSQADHKNRNRLDNRKSNLRIVTQKQNSRNLSSRGGSSKYRGVSWHRRMNKWSASVTVDGARAHIGYFSNERKAAQAAKEFRLAHMEGALD